MIAEEINGMSIGEILDRAKESEDRRHIAMIVDDSLNSPKYPETERFEDFPTLGIRTKYFSQAEYESYWEQERALASPLP